MSQIKEVVNEQDAVCLEFEDANMKENELKEIERGFEKRDNYDERIDKMEEKEEQNGKLNAYDDNENCSTDKNQHNMDQETKASYDSSLETEIQDNESKVEETKKRIDWKEKVKEMKGKIIGLSQQTELMKSLSESANQIERIADLAASLDLKFNETLKILELLSMVEQTKEIWLEQVSELCDILVGGNINTSNKQMKKEAQQVIQRKQEQQQQQSHSLLGVLLAKDNTQVNRYHQFINIKMVQLLATHISEHILQDLENGYQRLADVSVEAQHHENRHQAMNDAIIAHMKLKHTLQIFPHAAISDKTDLFSLHPEDEKWKKLRENVVVKQINSPKVMHESMQNVIKGCLIGHAVIASGDLQQNAFKKGICLNLGTIYYFFQPQKAQLQAKSFFSNPTAVNAVKVLNIMDNGLLKYFMQITFPSIKYHKRIHIDPVVRNITLESTLKEYQTGTIFKAEVDQEKKEQYKQDIQKAKLDICGTTEEHENEYYKRLFETENNQNSSLTNHSKISIRILSSQKLIKPKYEQLQDVVAENVDNEAAVGESDSADIEKNSHEKPQTDGMFSKIKNMIIGQKKEFFEELVIHIHGGGFVGMSSRCSQVYSRLWAKQINVPIFSIDYKKAPEHPYPAALDDVWQSYNWILNFVSRFFNIKPKKIILIGDSAGGNLSVGLAFRCLQTGVRAPDGIVMAYPSLNLNPNAFTPSFLLAFHDPIISIQFLKICLESYIPESLGVKPDSDPFISPSYACDDLVRQLPPIRILIGTNDPLHDECWRFYQRLKSLKNDVKMTVYNGMPHGFLNYVGPLDMKEAYVCVKDSADFAKELLAMS